MKKTLALVLALVLTLSLFSVAYAADKTATTTLVYKDNRAVTWDWLIPAEMVLDTTAEHITSKKIGEVAFIDPLIELGGSLRIEFEGKGYMNNEIVMKNGASEEIGATATLKQDPGVDHKLGFVYDGVVRDELVCPVLFSIKGTKGGEGTIHDVLSKKFISDYTGEVTFASEYTAPAAD